MALIFKEMLKPSCHKRNAKHNKGILLQTDRIGKKSDIWKNARYWGSPATGTIWSFLIRVWTSISHSNGQFDSCAVKNACSLSKTNSPQVSKGTSMKVFIAELFGMGRVRSSLGEHWSQMW